tara:strand:+ start:137 stop:526 length:390 start_codon:yes stop_codon:yes gene_type:complete
MATKTERFDAAFINARERGAKTFTFEGKKYNTGTAEEQLATRRQREASEDAADLSESDRSRTEYRKRRNKEYTDFIVDKRKTNTEETGFLSRGAQMRADAAIKERTQKKSSGGMVTMSSRNTTIKGPYG